MGRLAATTASTSSWSSTARRSCGSTWRLTSRTIFATTRFSARSSRTSAAEVMIEEDCWRRRAR
eukprot:6306706-Heterocapsa_arctica.AAC.1